MPCGEIADYRAVLNDPHLAARDFFVDLVHPRLGTLRALGTPLRFETSHATFERAGPLLGEHTRAVLGEAGCAPAEVERLIGEGAALAA